MNKIFGIILFVFSIVVLAVILYFTREIRDEGFFVSPGVFDQMTSTDGFDNSGALTQLDSTRIVSKKEQDIDDEIYDNLTRQGIMNMTESGYKGSDYTSTRAMY